ncbi:glycosyltransferase family 4 protein [Polaromonas sp.]|uniref:glycosyltransferase family 4 protein n=1 Tax=Polaromonas sp. TaxID=1869339 RepID=UPI003263D0FE
MNEIAPMRILFCCQLYAPSVGGVQEVIRQIAERLVRRGHSVTVATSALPNRDFEVLNGVHVVSFAVSGNFVEGMSGDVVTYQDFVVSSDFDVMLVYAAQQWTFDALWPVLDRIPYAKILVPCGFSNFYEPAYARYFEVMPAILAKFEQLVFNATHYRDIDLAHRHGLTNFTILPNGASEDMFNVTADPLFRVRHGIPDDSFLFLTVGSLTGLKGHAELVRAFAQLEIPPGRHATLLLNGNVIQRLENGGIALARKFVGLVRSRGFAYSIRQVWDKIIRKKIAEYAGAQRTNQTDRRVLVTDFERLELTQAFFAADLFVLASNIEYSPLVLFESAAAGTPFLTVSAGNSAEIAEWTGAGVVCPSTVDSRGYTRVDDRILATSMATLMVEPARLAHLGQTGRETWKQQFTWKTIAIRYEELFYRLVQEKVDAK